MDTRILGISLNTLTRLADGFEFESTRPEHESNMFRIHPMKLIVSIGSPASLSGIQCGSYCVVGSNHTLARLQSKSSIIDLSMNLSNGKYRKLMRSIVQLTLSFVFTVQVRLQLPCR
jgi:hypothetical protein